MGHKLELNEFWKEQKKREQNSFTPIFVFLSSEKDHCLIKVEADSLMNMTDIFNEILQTPTDEMIDGKSTFSLLLLSNN